MLWDKRSWKCLDGNDNCSHFWLLLSGMYWLWSGHGTQNLHPVESCLYGVCEDKSVFSSFFSPWCQTPCPAWTSGLHWVSWISFRQQLKSHWEKPIKCLGPSFQVLRDGLIYCTACVLLHVRWWPGANFCMCWPLCPIWDLTVIIFTYRAMKLYIIFFLALVNKETSNYQLPDGTSCELVRLSLCLAPLRAWVRLGLPCYRHCTSSCSLWEGKPPGPGFLRWKRWDLQV